MAATGEAADASYAAFVTEQLPRLLGYGRALTGNPHDAWDLVQQALVRIGVRWERIDAQGNPAAYARTTMVRLNVDRTRRLRRERAVAVVHDRAVAARLPDGIEPWLDAAMGGLTPRQRTALVLRFVDDLDVAGVAAAMGCTVGTAKSHLSRGVARLRECAPVGSRLAVPGGANDDSAADETNDGGRDV